MKKNSLFLVVNFILIVICFAKMKGNSNLKNLLHTIWPNLKAGRPDDWLWKHEWEAHGYCIRQSLSPTQYFQAAEKIHQKFLC